MQAGYPEKNRSWERALRKRATHEIFHQILFLAAMFLFLLFLPAFLALPNWCFAVFYRHWHYLGLLWGDESTFLQKFAIFLALYFVGLSVWMVIVGYRQWKDTQRLIRRDPATTEIYIPDVTEPLVYPVVIRCPASTWGVIFMFVVMALIFRFAFWNPGGMFVPADPRFDVFSDILAIAISLGMCVPLVFLDVTAYEADSQGLTVRYRLGIQRRISWQDVQLITYSPIAQSGNARSVGEVYDIKTARRPIHFTVPQAKKKASLTPAQQELQERLRQIILIASHASGQPIMVLKRHYHEREKLTAPRKQTQQEKRRGALFMALFFLIGAPISVGGGIWLLAWNHVEHFHNISGRIAAYDNTAGTLRLQGDTMTYSLFTETSGDNSYQPALPTTVAAGTFVTIYIGNPGLTTTYIDAFQWYDAYGVPKQFSEDDYYRNPIGHYHENLIGFSCIIGFGVLFLIGGVASLFWWRRLRDAPMALMPSQTNEVADHADQRDQHE